MTPNQAQELHDVIRTSGLTHDEQRRLHIVVDGAITTPPRKGHGYIRLIANGDPFDTVIEAVDAAGNYVGLEIEAMSFDLDCKRGRLVLTGSPKFAIKPPATGYQAVLTLPVGDVDITRLGEALGPQVYDMDAAPDDEPADTELVDIDTDDVITKVETPKPRGEAPRGPHEHTFVNGTCGWCGKRE